MFSCFKTTALYIAIAVSITGCGGNIKPYDVNVEITSFLGDNQTFVAGDSMQFLINLSTDAYLHLFYENANGQVVQLIPSVLQQNSFYKAGDFIVFPPEDGDIQLSVSAPFGSERLWLAACDKGVSIPSSGKVFHLDGFSGGIGEVTGLFLDSARLSGTRCSVDQLMFTTQR